MAWFPLHLPGPTVCNPREGGEDRVALPRACGGEEEGAGILRSLAESESAREIQCCHTNPPASVLSRYPQGSPGAGPGHAGHSSQAGVTEACCHRSPR